LVQVNRRRFLLALGAAGFSVAVPAQSKARRVVSLSVASAPAWSFLRESLEGRDIVFDALSAGGRFAALDKLAADAVRARPRLIVANGTAAVMAAKRASSRIPIVMAPAIDVAAAANVTGVAIDGATLAARIFNLVRETRLNARRIAMLTNADDPSAHPFVLALNQAATRTRVPVGMSRVRTPADYELAFEQWERLGLQAVLVHSSVDQARAAGLALKHRLPAIGMASGFIEAGGLASYSESPRDVGRRAAGYVERILKGAKPGELPVEQLRAFDLAVNLKTAKTIELDLPDSLLARADAMIQ
jgi:putative ABC transport system substrate-binding protein